MLIMDLNEVTGVIRRAVQESNKHFLLSYLDKNGFPHSNFMGFAHLNRNHTVVMIFRSSSSRVSILKEQPWIELVFNSRDYSHIVKFFGKVILTKSPATVVKLQKAYPFLNEYFSEDGSDSILVQLQTQMVEVESLPENGKWHDGRQFLIEDGQLVEADNPDIQGAMVGFAEPDQTGFDDIRRVITRNHGELLLGAINGEYDSFVSLLSGRYSGPGGAGRDDYQERISAQYSGINLVNSEINWGLRDFVQHKDGTVECLYFLDVKTPEGKEVNTRSRETWIQEADGWVLLSEELI